MYMSLPPDESSLLCANQLIFVGVSESSLSPSKVFWPKSNIRAPGVCVIISTTAIYSGSLAQLSTRLNEYRVVDWHKTRSVRLISYFFSWRGQVYCLSIFEIRILSESCCADVTSQKDRREWASGFWNDIMCGSNRQAGLRTAAFR